MTYGGILPRSVRMSSSWSSFGSATPLNGEFEANRNDVEANFLATVDLAPADRPHRRSRRVRSGAEVTERVQRIADDRNLQESIEHWLERLSETCRTLLQVAAVIGRDVANTLFPFVNALDKEISINGRGYRVVGVLAERDVFLVGAEDPNNENKAVYLPYLTLRKLYPDVDDNFVMAQARPGMMKEAVEEVRDLLRRRRKVAFGAPDHTGYGGGQRLGQFGAVVVGMMGQQQRQQILIECRPRGAGACP